MFSRGEVSFELLTDDRFDIDKTLVDQFIQQRQKSGRLLGISKESNWNTKLRRR